ncbi:hypothetical protein H4219_005042 [Mycoemilia scoparia]|uniref:Uncharacterized protein n=1 Tax=Mycoemilia scoparia TaxID=417184 RepID=A0A9W8DQA4_9FUNG|nr:hypothetical protein H4219_005042 [Mycoemilia scoparia]
MSLGSTDNYSSTISYGQQLNRLTLHQQYAQLNKSEETSQPQRFRTAWNMYKTIEKEQKAEILSEKRTKEMIFAWYVLAMVKANPITQNPFFCYFLEKYKYISGKVPNFGAKVDKAPRCNPTLSSPCHDDGHSDDDNENKAQIEDDSKFLKFLLATLTRILVNDTEKASSKQLGSLTLNQLISEGSVFLQWQQKDGNLESDDIQNHPNLVTSLCQQSIKEPESLDIPTTAKGRTPNISKNIKDNSNINSSGDTTKYVGDDGCGANEDIKYDLSIVRQLLKKASK